MGDAKKIDVQIILPECSEDEISAGLRRLTKAINRLDPERVAHGFLGGEHGYGALWENDVFEMRPYYWGDCDCGYEEREAEWCDANAHAAECYSTKLAERLAPMKALREKNRNRIPWQAQNAAEEEAARALCAEMGLKWERYGWMCRCTCDYEPNWLKWSAANSHKPTCATVLPNFRHKASGYEVRWYKYIGRDMEFRGECDWPAVLAESVKSLKSSERMA
jgi:hypothetical protein